MSISIDMKVIDEPTEPGEYYMEDEGGGPTPYICELINGNLRCGPRMTPHRFPIELLRMSTTIWYREQINT